MNIKSEKDFWSGLMFIVAGIGFAWGALNYNFGSSARPGPAYFPFGLGVLLAVLGLIILFKALTVEVDGEEKFGAVAWRPISLIIVSVAVFGALVPRLGMFISLPVLVVLASLAGDEFHWGEVIVNAVLLTVFSWVIFIWGLGLTIPLWPTIGLAK